MTKILKIESWKIFFGIIILPIISIVIGAVLVRMTQYAYWAIIAAIIATLSMCITYFGWLWTAGVSIYKLQGEKSKPGLNIFKILLIFPIIFSFIISPFFKAYLPVQRYELLLGSLGFISLLCFLTSLYLIVRNLEKVEGSKLEKRRYLILDFVLVWFLPIGIWFIQPRLRKLITAVEVL